MRNTIIDNMRGLCVLGVLGVHVGAATIETIDSFTLLCFLEILSRYSVPTFFFISGFGLFINKKEEGYLNFIKKRFRVAGIPYIFWSLFYKAYFTFVLPVGSIIWYPSYIAYSLFFGLGAIHLYFMVILLWFYTLQPLWCKLVNTINKNIIIGMGSLFIFQVYFYWLNVNVQIDTESWGFFAKKLYDYRLNYLPLFYIFVFVLGAIIALRWNSFLSNLRKYSPMVILAHIAATAYLIYCTHTSYTVDNFTFLELVYTYHQLSYQGFLYTITSILTFCLFLDFIERKATNSQSLSKLLKGISAISAHSTFIYFVHPFFIYCLEDISFYFGIVLTNKKTILFYLIILTTSLLTSILFTTLFKKSKLARLLLIGK